MPYSEDKALIQRMNKCFTDFELDLNNEKLAKGLLPIISSLNPFNIQELIHLVSKSQRATQIIKNSENHKAFFFLGTSGQGKSTTILALCGEDMEVTYPKGLKHIEAKKPLKNPQLETVVSSPFSQSETLSINAISVERRGR